MADLPPLLIVVLLCNLPAYICAGMAVWRKLDNGETYEAVLFSIIILVLFAEAYLAAVVLDPDTITREARIAQVNISTLFIPLLFMFTSPSGGADRVTPTAILLFALTLLLFTPAVALDWNPIYRRITLGAPVYDYGVSFLWHGRFVYYCSWGAIILVLQSIVALRQVRKIASFVHAHGAHYSRVTRAVLIWDFSCGFYLSGFFLLPASFWQQPVMRWVFFIVSSLIITIGSLLIYFGFDFNPVSDKEGKRFSLNEFIAENGELLQRLRYLVEDENICLERGIQAETLIQRLKTNHVFFERMVRLQYGCSFPELVNMRRIEHAKELLHHTRDLDRIAHQCGYPDTQVLLTMYERVEGEPLKIN